MSELYDFRIKQSAYVQALETYRKMEKLLETEKTNQETNAVAMHYSWISGSEETFQNENKKFLDEGRYNKAYNQVRAMRELIEDTLPEVNALLARCEGFIDQLQSDSYVEPVRPAEGDNASRNGGILSLNYDVTSVIKDKSEQVVEDMLTLVDKLSDAMSNCSSVVGGVSGELSALRSAALKLRRIENYKDSFQKYEAGVKALEFDLNIRLAALADGVEDILSRTDILEEKPLEADELLADIKALYGEETYIRCLDLLNYNADGSYAFEAMLKEGELTSQDIRALSYVYNSAFDRLEAAETEEDCKVEKDILEHYIQSLYVVYEEEPVQPGEPMMTYAVANDELIKKISGYLPEEDNLASETLESIMGSRYELSAVWFEHDADEWPKKISELKDFQNTPLMGVDISLTELGAIVEITACPDATYRDVYGEAEKDAHRVNGIYRTTNHVENTFSEDELARLAGLEYSVDDVVALYRLTENDTDIGFLDDLFRGDYIEAFNTKEYELGENTKTTLAHYGLHLYNLMYEKDNKELQDFVNGILYVDEERCYDTMYLPEDYLSLLEVETKGIREMYTALLFTGEEFGEEAKQESRKINQMCSFWMSLSDVMTRSDIDITGKYEDYMTYSSGHRTVQISDIGFEIKKIGNDIVETEILEFDLVLMNSDNKDVIWKEYEVESSVSWTPTKTFGDKLLDEKKTLMKELDTLFLRKTADGALSLMEMSFPGAVNAIGIAEAMLEGSVSDTLGGIKGQKIDGKEMPESGQCAFDILSSITGYMEARDSLLREYNGKTEDMLRVWFYSGNQYYLNKEYSYLDEGIYNYDVIQGIRRWDEEGIHFMVEEHENSLIYDAICDDDDFQACNEEKMNALAYMIYGKEAKNRVPNYTGNYESVVEIDGDIFTQLVQDIDNVVFAAEKYSNVLDSDLLKRWTELYGK